jgi:radical SAM superfamily enzyme YgiQ (UPF0313 family)|tara:strand:+ start:362 stop:1903 length:1542 start_codon:yes stop_codon:yes gene_type:complete
MKYKVALISFDCIQDLGIQSLHSVLSHSGYDSKSFHIKSDPWTLDQKSIINEEDTDILLNSLIDINPNLVGISLKSIAYDHTKKLTESIKKLLPNVKTIWGGTHPSILPEECVDFADFVCVGEGEEPLLELVKNLSNGNNTREIQSIWSNENGAVYRNPTRCVINDIDKIPLPLIGDRNQFYIFKGRKENSLPYPEWMTMTIRGCPFKCSYCANETIIEAFKRKKLRRRSVNHVIEELVLVKSNLRNVRMITINDDVFTVNKKWVKEFSSLYKEKIGIPFVVQVHPLYVNEQTLSHLKDAGMVSITMGIQSGSERVRKEIFFRNTSNQQLVDAVNVINKLKFHSRFDIIHDNPYETRQDKLETVELLLKLRRPFYLTIYSLCWFPRTKLTEKALKDGFITKQHIEGKFKKAMLYESGSGLFKTEEDIFFADLYYLAVTNYFPRPVVRLFKNYAFLERNPIFLKSITTFVQLCKAFFLIISGAYKVLIGKGSRENILGGFELVKRHLKLRRYGT